MNDYLDALGEAHADRLEVHRNPDFVCLKPSRNKPRVGLVSGCGAGNAPLATGYVWPGLLDAACPGPGFASPAVDQIVEASKTADSGEGILHIVPHLKGDSEAFQAAADKLRDQGVRVRDVTIDDDISQSDPRHTVGRRALGTVIVASRICGAAAEAGLHLNRVAQLCKEVNASGKSLAATLKFGSVLRDIDVEIGTGLAGEAGIKTLRVTTPADLANILTDRILLDGPFTRYVTEWDLENWRWHEVALRDVSFRSGDQALCLVSSLGPQPVCDLEEMVELVRDRATEAGVTVSRHLSGHMMSAPNQNGICLTLVRMTDELLGYWDRGAGAPALAALR